MKWHNKLVSSWTALLIFLADWNSLLQTTLLVNMTKIVRKTDATICLHRRRVIGFSLFAWVLWGLLYLRVYQELELGPAKTWLSCGLDLNWDVDQGLWFYWGGTSLICNSALQTAEGAVEEGSLSSGSHHWCSPTWKFRGFSCWFYLFPSLPWRASNLTCTRCILVEQNRFCQSSRQQRTKKQHTATADGPF